MSFSPFFEGAASCLPPSLEAPAGPRRCGDCDRPFALSFPRIHLGHVDFAFSPPPLPPAAAAPVAAFALAPATVCCCFSFSLTLAPLPKKGVFDLGTEASSAGGLNVGCSGGEVGATFGCGTCCCRRSCCGGGKSGLILAGFARFAFGTAALGTSARAGCAPNAFVAATGAAPMTLLTDASFPSLALGGGKLSQPRGGWGGGSWGLLILGLLILGLLAFGLLAWGLLAWGLLACGLLAWGLLALRLLAFGLFSWGPFSWGPLLEMLSFGFRPGNGCWADSVEAAVAAAEALADPPGTFLVFTAGAGVALDWSLC
mmetsp:Transcript_14442/g.32825  ORF Transcript_14442/g.32825 Transcript_14442/m.32825 type:complete len:314 (+) Transcript_14442:252-1193(+)